MLISKVVEHMSRTSLFSKDSLTIFTLPDRLTLTIEVNSVRRKGTMVPD
jgi:hypothetical protein